MHALNTVVKSINSSFSSQGKQPSDQHIKQVCMRVMQGKKRYAFDPIYHSPVPHFMTLIRPRMPHYTTTHRATATFSHLSEWLLNTLNLKKRRSHSQNMK